MLILLSPAKTLDFQNKNIIEYTLPNLLNESQELINFCKKLTADDLKSLMKVSDKIANLNVERFHNWHSDFNLENALQAISVFKGDVYEGLMADSFNLDTYNYAQEHLRILSGLYGVLKPLDLIQAYRLEMGTKLVTNRGNNLYKFWNDIVTDEINKDLLSNKINIVVNLASNEYFKVVNFKKLIAKIITPVFQDYKNGEYKIISFYAKKARGMMARYILENKIDNIEDLKKFDISGYSYFESKEDKLIFRRDS